MKLIAETALLVAMSLASDIAFAQSETLREPISPPTAVSAARCAYTDGEARCSSHEGRSSTAASPQFPRRPPAPSAYPPPPPRYRFRTERGPALKGALIGGLIGFGFGSIPSGNRNTQARLGLGALVGFIGAGLGAAIGADHALYPYHHRYRYAPWPDDGAEDEMSTRRPTRPRSATQSYANSSSHGSTSSETNQNSAPQGTAGPLPASDKLASRTGLLP